MLECVAGMDFWICLCLPNKSKPIPNPKFSLSCYLLNKGSSEVESVPSTLEMGFVIHRWYGDTVGSGIALQARRSWIRFLIWGQGSFLCGVCCGCLSFFPKTCMSREPEMLCCLQVGMCLSVSCVGLVDCPQCFFHLMPAGIGSSTPARPWLRISGLENIYIYNYTRQ